MRYRSELDFFIRILGNMNLEAHIISGNDFPDNIDRGLRSFLGISTDRTSLFSQLQKELRQNTVYVITDEFLCNYIMFFLPETTDSRLFICGPYITSEITRKNLMEHAEKNDISPQIFTHLSKYYGNITLISDETALFSVINSFGEILWQSIDNFTTQKLEEKSAISVNTDIIKSLEEKPEESMLTVSIIESRYQAEQRLMDAVSKGQAHKVAHLIGHASEFVFENRTQDNLRNIKNYMVVMNTLLRKAAQAGGVPPYFIDKLSSEFAKKIENSADGKEIEKLASEMVELYSKLVREHSLKKYSEAVQKAMSIIDCDLTADLGLKNIAQTLNINPSYFSTLFKKETGKTYTDYVNEQRINNAKRLLTSTTLQIQTVAQHCGILDVNYFTKLFKKYTGKTPGQYKQ